MRLIPFLLLVSINFVSSAQTFVAEAELSTVSKDGFYNIRITPAESSYLNRGFTNIRIFDDKNKEVPYLLRTETPHNVTEVFREYNIIEKGQVKDCCTSLILSNADQRLLNNIHLVVRNADVTKEATLLGSDDRINWFALKEYFILSPAKNTKGTFDIKIVDFPLSNYEYYSLRINDSTSAPLNILTAGYFEVETENGRYTEVNAAKQVKTDSAKEKKTYLRIQFNEPQTVDKFELTMKGAPFFQRRATVYVPKTRSLKGGKIESYNDPVQEIEITSKRPTSIELPALKVKELMIVINNQDNPALNLDAFKAYQLNRYLTAWLTSGTAYTVKVGQQDQSAPVYDISFFKDSIPENPAELEIGTIKFFAAEESVPTGTIFTTKAYIWAAVVAVIVVLGFMSVRLLNEAGNTPKSP
jgi:hypothetical protein